MFLPLPRLPRLPIAPPKRRASRPRITPMHHTKFCYAYRWQLAGACRAGAMVSALPRLPILPIGAAHHGRASHWRRAWRPPLQCINDLLSIINHLLMAVCRRPGGGGARAAPSRSRRDRKQFFIFRKPKTPFRFYFLQTQPAMLYKIYGSLFAPL